MDIGRLALCLAVVAGACGTSEPTTGIVEPGATTTLTTLPSTSAAPPGTTAITTSSTSMQPSSTESAAGETVLVFFSPSNASDCGDVDGFLRVRDPDSSPVISAVSHLLRGPNAKEKAKGATSWFSEETTNALLSSMLEGEELTLNFTDLWGLIPNASSSCGSAVLLSQLSHTVFQFSEIDTLYLQMNGSCEGFWNFLQMECTELYRDEFVASAGYKLWAGS